MNVILLVGIIMIIAALSCKVTDKAGLPILVGFILIGVLIGGRFQFEDISNAERICNFALLIIIFTGGFQTNFSEARPVLGISCLMSTAGTALTAFVAGAFGYYAMGLSFYEAMLLGSVLSCTDAASVFSILRSKNLSLKNNLNSVLQIESGSNDPMAYLLTVAFLTLAAGGSMSIPALLVIQLAAGAAAGVTGAKLGQYVINRLNLEIEGLYTVLLVGAAFFIYGAAVQFGGNGFLAVYIGGIMMGNVKLARKKIMAGMLSSLSMLAQVGLFIILGVLCVPSAVIQVAGSGLLFAIFLLFAARPLVVFLLMKPFGRSMKEIALVSWAGFRGASSIVFATYLMSAGLPYAQFVFSVVFFVCMLSVILQGSLLPALTKALDLFSPEPQVLKTFTEFTAEIESELLEATVPYKSAVCGKTILELGLPDDLRIILIKRENHYIAPIHSTVLMENDVVMLSGSSREKLVKINEMIGG